MKLIEDLQLTSKPYRLTLHEETVANFKGFYHAHQGIEFLIVHEGRGHVVVDQRVYSIEPGTLFCFQPFQLHRIHMEVTPSSPYIRSVLVFEPTALHASLHAFPALQKFLFHLWKDKLDCIVLRGLTADNRLYHYLELYQEGFSAFYNSDPLEDSALFMTHFLHILMPHWLTAEHANQAPVLRISSHTENILQWVEAHYSEDFKLADLAESLHLSKYHVSHLFKQDTGSTIEEYLVARRIRQACWLLKTTDLTVQAVGMAVGYNNSPYFNQIFKKAIRCTPMQYRR